MWRGYSAHKLKKMSQHTCTGQPELSKHRKKTIHRVANVEGGYEPTEQAEDGRLKGQQDGCDTEYERPGDDWEIKVFLARDASFKDQANGDKMRMAHHEQGQMKLHSKKEQNRTEGRRNGSARTCH